MAHQHDIHSWRAWYADGTRYTSRDHVWTELPDEGCIVLLIYKEQQYAPGKHYRAIYDATDLIGMGSNWVFQLSLNDWTGKVGRDLIRLGFADQPQSSTNEWKFGVGVSDEEYLAAQAAAHAEQEPP